MRSWRVETTLRKPMNTRQGRSGKAPILALLMAAICTLIVPFGSVRAQEQPDTLMLVREWNAGSGVLIGWLPTHRIAMGFRIIGHQPNADFIANEAVSIIWTKRKSTLGGIGDIHISPAPREFEGKEWLPLMRDANVVRIKHHLFLINQIIFEGSQYERATKLENIACSDAQRTAKSFAENTCRQGQ